MRGRSDPMKIDAQINGSWEPSVARTDEEDEVVEDKDLIEEHLEMPLQKLEVGQNQVMILDQDQENAQQDEGNQDQEDVNVQQDEANQDQEQDIVQQVEVGQDQEQDIVQYYEVGEGQEDNQTEEEEESFYLVSLFEEIMNQDYYEIQEYDEAHEEDEVVEIEADESTTMTEVAEIFETHEGNGVLERESEVKEERESEVLPECLLMMMYEPKLSMEVSKETWVCRTDFIQRQSSKKKPPAPAPLPVSAKPDGGDESSVSVATVNDVMRVAGGGFPTALPLPARSSMAMVVEQKLAKAVGYEPFVLTRCKSEPMKTVASSKLQPESCVLENRKLERLSRVAFSVGAAGLGF
ncbi:hypothetical protein L1987_70632 [Smallanthus sonchifolius]|uniref:Uncharacterized protein n=1 Tax=Smallanthus sonchifolius TaxID=185202 RepID=A0ACB9ART1_9ASTR|nr:hypothetical protein L1987_70632 [Smallanthus sonchifolius]